MTALKNLATFTVTLVTFVSSHCAYLYARPLWTDALWDSQAQALQWVVCLVVSGLVFWAMLRRFGK
jgi:hypothetical protein